MAQDFQSSRGGMQSVGFHELRQALEISSLKQDMERVAQETEGLRTHIEDTVELVRVRFAAMTPEELADANCMAPILQLAIKTLMNIRDAVRRIEVQSGPVPDADRANPPPIVLPPAIPLSESLFATNAPPSRNAPPAPVAAPPQIVVPAPVAPPPQILAPAPASPSPQIVASASSSSRQPPTVTPYIPPPSPAPWLAAPGSTPPRSNDAENRPKKASSPSTPPHPMATDWLGPPRR